MNFRQRLTNTLFILLCVIPTTVTLWNVIYELIQGDPQLTLAEVLAFVCIPPLFVSGLSFLMGAGFKVWNKSK